MGVRRLRSQEQTSKWGTARRKSSSSEESTREQIQGENNHYSYFFSDSRGIVHKDFVPSGPTDNHAFYKTSWNDFENGSSESERTLPKAGLRTTVTRRLTLRFRFENFW